MKELGINYIHQSTAHHNNNWVSEKHENLFKIFKLKNLILDIDDFETDAPSPDPEKIEMINDIDAIGIKNDLVISHSIEKTESSRDTHKESFKEIEEIEKNVKRFNLKAELERLQELESKKFHKNASDNVDKTIGYILDWNY